MKSYVLVILLSGLTAILIAQEPLNLTIMDEKSGKEILIGKCDRSGLETGDFGQFFHDEYNAYHPDSTTLTALKEDLDAYSIVIVLATWCGDSKEQTGRFFRILDETDFPGEKLELFCVDRGKKAGDVDISRYAIEKVPTFILFKDGTEKGRITETPVNTLERDLLSLIR